MPQRQEHLDQARANEELSLALEAGGQYAWAVAVLFYAALHLVEAYLAASGRHPESHAARGRLFRADSGLSAAWRFYDDLDSFSRDARYRCVPFSAADVEAIRRQQFEPLKPRIERLLPSP